MKIESDGENETVEMNELPAVFFYSLLFIRLFYLVFTCVFLLAVHA